MAIPSPSPQAFLAASEVTFQEVPDLGTLQLALKGALSAPELATWKPLLISSQISQTYAAAGMYADAFQLGTGSSAQVVIAFEGSAHKEQWLNDNLLVLQGITPPALPDALNFTNEVIKRAGIPASQVFVTGFSLGGLEAEYVGWKLKLAGGSTFAAPGVPGYNSGAQTTLIDYVEYGDPVANYASDRQLAEAGLPPPNMAHVGTVKLLGSALDAVGLFASASALLVSPYLGPDGALTALAGFLGVGSLGYTNHQPEHYAQDLQDFLKGNLPVVEDDQVVGMTTDRDVPSTPNGRRLSGSGSPPIPIGGGGDPSPSAPINSLTTSARDTLRGTSEALNGDLMKNFGGNDVIDVKIPLPFGTDIHGIEITQGFGGVGASKPSHVGSLYYSVDFAFNGDLGTPVLAEGNGTVVAVGNEIANNTIVTDTNDPRSFGNFVTIHYDSGFYATYEHLMQKNPTVVKIGDAVYTGTTLGYVGLTGNTTGAHLHVQFGDTTYQMSLGVIANGSTAANGNTPPILFATSEADNGILHTLSEFGGRVYDGDNLTTSSPPTMSFLSESGSNQTISAYTSAETLLGSQFGDTFQGTSANLNGDLIKLFGGNDAIDVTDLSFAHALLSYGGTPDTGTLTLGDGFRGAQIALAGNFHQAGFHLASDLHGGTNITYG